MFSYYGLPKMSYCHGGQHVISPDAKGTIRIEGAGTYCAEHLPPPEPPPYKPTLRESRRMEFSDEDRERLARHVIP